MFADDTNIYYESSDLLNIQKVVNRELRKVRKRLEANRLALNIDKTNFVIFHSHQHKLTDHILFKMGRKKIKQESCVKFLGLLLGSNLSWKFHLTELSKKLAKTAGLFYKIRHYAPKDTLILLYHGIFAPFLSYGISVWGLTYPTSLTAYLYFKIIIALKIITFEDLTSSSLPLFDSLCILQLNDTFKLQISSFVYECVYNLAPMYFRNYFTSIDSVHNIGTRQSSKGDLYAVRCNTTQYGLRSIHYSGVRLWNSVPNEIRDSHSLSSSRHKLKDYYLSIYKL